MTTRPDTVVALVTKTGGPDMRVAVIGDQVVDLTGATDGQVLTVQPDGTVAAEDPFDLDAMRFKGVINASTNPNYPAASAGDVYRISVAGKIGGGSGTNVEIGDLILAIATNVGGTQAAVGASWTVEQGNLDGAVIGPASVTDDLPAIFDGTTGKLIKSKTYAAFKTLLSLVKGDVGLGNVDNTSDANKPVSTATQTALDLKANLSVTINSQADDYTLALTDQGKVVEMTKATATTLTVPLNATIAFPTGTIIEVYQSGAGTVTVAAAGGVTLRTPGGAKTRVQYSTISLRKRDTDTWVVSGDTST